DSDPPRYGRSIITMTAPRVCAVVLNYNGAQHLDACLSSLMRAAAALRETCAVVLVDNRSSDGSIAFTLANFPTVEGVVTPENDCLFSLNEVLAARTEDIVILVNNDMRFAPDFVAPLLPHFDEPDVFAVGAAIYTWDGSAHTVGPRCARLQAGWF